MHTLGLDFGTTTSILSYYDGQYLHPFKLGGAAATPYIPSVLSIDKQDDSIEIGQAARLNQGDEDYDVYTHFKMLLTEQDTNRLTERGYAKHMPHEIAHLYIQHLLDSYHSESRLQTVIQNIVITVPEIWVREGHHAARETLRSICDELNLPNISLLSEPVAACVFFANCYHQQHSKDFEGHVLVCDYGGGTLDLSLSAVSKQQITVLEGTGKGSDRATLGAAGVAFDEAVVQRILQHNGQTDTPPRRFYRLLKEFEEHKIAQTERLSKFLERYRRNPATNKKVFEIGEMSATCADLCDVFDELVAPQLDKALADMHDYLTQQAIDTQNPDHFHIVMVGGFSNFYLVRHHIRQFFDSRTEADARFQNPFDLSDTALAISKGAALVAQGAFQVENTCPINMGIRAKNQFLEDTDIPLLKKGIPLKNYHAPQFTRMWLEVMSDEALDNTSLKLFLDVGNGRRRYIDLQGRLRELIPNPDKDNRWRIGCAVNDDLLFTLHIEDRNGECKIISMGNLQDKLQGLHISEVDTP